MRSEIPRPCAHVTPHAEDALSAPAHDAPAGLESKLRASSSPDSHSSSTHAWLAAPESGEHVNIEFWGHALPEGKYGKIGNDPLPNIPDTDFDNFNIAVRNNTYKTVRVIGEEYNVMYTVWCNGFKEFYDISVRILINFSEYLVEKADVE